ncbi:MAG: hypothetical protein MIO92_01840 [Methanosarcinaceae archaeon]|nr:hypothetical protein [Methanosarcinaceae archaeon]
MNRDLTRFNTRPVDALATTKAEMVVVVTLLVHDQASVPEGRTPPAPIFMGPVGIEYEPAPFHLRVPILTAAPACHLIFVEGQVHVLGGIAIEVIDHQRAAALGKKTGRKGVGSAIRPASPRASGGLGTGAGAYSFPVSVAIAPRLARAVLFIVRLPHEADRRIGASPCRQVEPIVRLFECPRTGPLPLMGIAYSLAHRFTDFNRFPGPHPDDRISAWDVGELELIDTCTRVFRLLHPRIVEGRHVLGPADPFKGRIFIMHAFPLKFFFALPDRDGMFGDGGIPLTHIARPGEDGAHLGHLFLGQVVNPLELAKKGLVLLSKGFDVLGEGLPGQDSQQEDGLQCNNTGLHGLTFLKR